MWLENTEIRLTSNLWFKANRGSQRARRSKREQGAFRIPKFSRGFDAVFVRTARGFAQQSQTAQPSGNQPRPTQTGPSSGPESSAMAGAQQQLYTASGSNGAQVSQDSFKGSIVEGKSTGNLMDLSLDEAIQRGLRNNLGVILQSAAQKNASGQRLEELQALLPTVTGAASINVQQVNLAAYGLKFPGLNPIIGPFQVVDFRAYLTQNLFNISALQNYIAAKHNFAAAKPDR